MDNPVSAISYLARAKHLITSEDRASLIYAALELRCGVEARLQEHALTAVGISKGQATQWEITKLAKTIDGAFGLGDSFMFLFLHMEDGRECTFLYAPVSKRLQSLAKRCGDYLHAIALERIQNPGFWAELRNILNEGCSLLEVSCRSEILRPTFEHGLHFSLAPDDPRIEVIKDIQAGANGTFTTAEITPTGPVSVYLPEVASTTSSGNSTDEAA